MPERLRVRVSRTHYMAHAYDRDARARRALGAQRFYNRWCGWSGGSRASGVAVVTDERRVVACLRFLVLGRDVVKEKGVWVDSRYRGQGLGQKLLDAVMRHTGASTILVKPCTHHGRRWMRSAAKRYLVIDALRNTI